VSPAGELCGSGKRFKGVSTMMQVVMAFDHHETGDEAITASTEQGGVSLR
jgi:hypothetical protein